MDNLTFVSSVSLSDDIWKRQQSLLNRLEPGDKIDVAGESCLVIGEKNGHVEIDHPSLGRATVDPLSITNIRI